MTPERLLLAAMHSIIDTTSGADMKRAGDYLTTNSTTTEHFAWLPKTMSNRKRVWFKRYVKVRYFIDVLGRQSGTNYYTTYFTPEDHMINVLQGRSFGVDANTEFTGNPYYNKHSRYYKNLKS